MRAASEKAFRTMYHAVLEPGTLDVKTKELMAIVAAVSRLCEHCLHHHVPLAVKAGASREELLESLDVAVLMGGGPAHAFSKVAIRIFDDAAGPSTPTA
ncbi:MAG: carboxymuconolactone decarboxylase family protein [Phycisphaerales bacterium]|jgi:AhpD family alkylhydroperoxidase|nr:carboxymuconolactone decarboxylase family protein [Phycisphaerales bacterium]